MSTSAYQPDPAVHFFNHPTTPSLYMFMLCYKNGRLAREQIRNVLNADPNSKDWAEFDKYAGNTSPLCKDENSGLMRLGLFFPLPEIVPNVRAGIWRYNYNPRSKELTKLQEDVGSPSGDPTISQKNVGNSIQNLTTTQHDALTIVESQFLSLRLRSRKLVSSPGSGLPPQPRRIYLVGGGSTNKTIASIAGNALGGKEGVFKLDIGGNACALGAAYRAVWAA